jgi:hypothetical protein
MPLKFSVMLSSLEFCREGNKQLPAQIIVGRIGIGGSAVARDVRRRNDRRVLSGCDGDESRTRPVDNTHKAQRWQLLSRGTGSSVPRYRYGQSTSGGVGS